jgi:hypothetical protein
VKGYWGLEPDVIIYNLMTHELFVDDTGGYVFKLCKFLSDGRTMIGLSDGRTIYLKSAKEEYESREAVSNVRSESVSSNRVLMLTESQFGRIFLTENRE